MTISNRDHHQWQRELLTDAFSRLETKCYQEFDKNITELDADERATLLSYLKQDTLPVIKCIYAQLIEELK